MNGIGAYQDNLVTTQKRGRLIVLLYEGAIKFMKLAIKEMEENNEQAKVHYINKAQDIINELNTVLDMNAGGEIAENLRKLYFFIHNRLSQASIKHDPKMIWEAIELMEEMNHGWKAISS